MEGLTVERLRRESEFGAIPGSADRERWRPTVAPQPAGEIRRAVLSRDRRAVALGRAGWLVWLRRLEQPRPLGGRLCAARSEPLRGGAGRGGIPARPESPARRCPEDGDEPEEGSPRAGPVPARRGGVDRGGGAGPPGLRDGRGAQSGLARLAPAAA